MSFVIVQLAAEPRGRRLKPREHWDGRSRLLTPPVRKSKALLKSKSKR